MPNRETLHLLSIILCRLSFVLKCKGACVRWKTPGDHVNKQEKTNDFADSSETYIFYDVTRTSYSQTRYTISAVLR